MVKMMAMTMGQLDSMRVVEQKDSHNDSIIAITSAEGVGKIKDDSESTTQEAKII